MKGSEGQRNWITRVVLLLGKGLRLQRGRSRGLSTREQSCQRTRSFTPGSRTSRILRTGVLLRIAWSGPVSSRSDGSSELIHASTGTPAAYLAHPTSPLRSREIQAADIFVGDVSFINQGAIGRQTPNPNVLGVIGLCCRATVRDKIICVFNKATGSIDELPFDIRPRLVRAYELVESQEKPEQRKALVSVLKADITSILHAPDKAEAEALQQLLSTLAPELISIIILSDEFEKRLINPWIDSLRSQFSAAANTLRHIAASDEAVHHSMVMELEELANGLDETASLQQSRGTWPMLQGLVKTVMDKAMAIKRSRIDSVPLSEAFAAEVKSTINTIQRKLAGLAGRAEDMANCGWLDDLQSEPSQLGYTLSKLVITTLTPLAWGKRRSGKSGVICT